MLFMVAASNPQDNFGGRLLTVERDIVHDDVESVINRVTKKQSQIVEAPWACRRVRKNILT
jgi:hypothetical protein